MLRKELQNYFDKVYPYTRIETEHTIRGQVRIQFELGGEIYKNGTNERVNQATKRAESLFRDTFNNPNSVIWVLIYECPEPNFSNSQMSIYTNNFLPNNLRNFIIK